MHYACIICTYTMHAYHTCILCNHVYVASVSRSKRCRDGLPAWLQRKNLTQCEHAVLLCRLAGLRKAATIDAPAEMGGSAFDAAAAQELERLVALSSAEVTAACSGVRRELQAEQSFALLTSGKRPPHFYASGAWLPGLWRVWLHEQGARLMGVGARWRDMLRADAACDTDVPRTFSLDDAVADFGIPDHLDAGQVRRGEGPLIGARWRLTWEATLAEVQERYGAALHVVCKPRDTPPDEERPVMAELPPPAELHFTMAELYIKLHRVPTDQTELRARDRDLLAVWRSLEDFEEVCGRRIEEREKGRLN